MKQPWPLTPVEEKFYAAFELKVDTITVKVQIDQIVLKMMTNLQQEYGDIIPKLSPEKLSEEFKKAANQ